MNIDKVAEVLRREIPQLGPAKEDAWNVASRVVAALGIAEIPDDVDYYDSPEEAIDNALNRTFQGTWEQQDQCKQWILEQIRRYGFKIVRDMTMDINHPEESRG
jgi:predicted CoA-binding protein